MPFESSPGQEQVFSLIDTATHTDTPTNQPTFLQAMYKLRLLLLAVVAACALAFVAPVPVRRVSKVRPRERQKSESPNTQSTDLGAYLPGVRRIRHINQSIDEYDILGLLTHMSQTPSFPPLFLLALQLQQYAAPPNLLTQADACLNGECSVEDVTELLTQIRVKVKDLKEQTAALQELEAELTGKNTGTDPVCAVAPGTVLWRSSRPTQPHAHSYTYKFPHPSWRR